jgi:hypothetical protein
MAIDIIKIFPTIGVARLRNTEDEIFIGLKILLHILMTTTTRAVKLSCRLQDLDFLDMRHDITIVDAFDIRWTVNSPTPKASWQRFVEIENQTFLNRNLPPAQGLEDRIANPGQCQKNIQGLVFGLDKDLAHDSHN